VTRLSVDCVLRLIVLMRPPKSRPRASAAARQLTLAFIITVSHRRRILLTSPGLTDKTLQLSDDLFRGIEDGNILGVVGSVALCLFLSTNALTWTFNVRYQFIEFELYENGSNGLVAVLDRGVWLFVDNGYLEHSSLLPPMKITTIQAEMRMSKWAESMRKDVECTFGILKGRHVRARCFSIFYRCFSCSV
jgi:hypothetical protein